MPDTISAERRSWNMSRIRGKDTKPELQFRSLLHKAGFRFRLHVKDLPGKPDIVLPKYKSVAFVHGCYWHRHKGCSLATTPKTRQDFWQKKFNDNVTGDRKVRAQLEQQGWRVFVAWECELKRNPQGLLNCFENFIKAGDNGP